MLSKDDMMWAAILAMNAIYIPFPEHKDRVPEAQATEKQRSLYRFVDWMMERRAQQLKMDEDEEAPEDQDEQKDKNEQKDKDEHKDQDEHDAYGDFKQKLDAYRISAERTGMWQGLLKGRQQGLQQGACNVVLRLLEKKFGTVSYRYRERISQMDADALLRLAERILSLGSLEELFKSSF